MKSTDVPDFGVLRGVNVLSMGSMIAGPFASGLMAEFGADVIQIENATSLDGMRVAADGMSWSTEHRNQRDLALDIRNSTGFEVFERLIHWADIWLESSKGGTYARLGMTDEAAWEINKKLVIVHVSGYGQSGVDEWVRRPGFDGTAQAFSGYMQWNGYKKEPMRVKPYTADYVPPILAAFSAVSALLRARDTGIGESIDVAQYEAMVRIQGRYLLEALNAERMTARTGNDEESWSVYNVFACVDGSLLVLINGRTMWLNAVKILGLDQDPAFADVPEIVIKPSPAAQKADQAVAMFCAERTVARAESELNSAGVSCSRVMTPGDMLEHPHFNARQTLTTWNDHVAGRTLIGPNIVPGFTNNPTQIWRSGPALSEDAADILEELGYSSEDREILFETETVLRP